MHKRNPVKSSTQLQLFKNVRLRGHSVDEAPLRASGAFKIELPELFNNKFGDTHRNRDDYYFTPGTHKDKTYRYLVNDTDFDHKDEFDFFLIPIDIDLHTEEGRDTWKDSEESQLVIDKLRKKSPFAASARSTSASRGGIRIIYVTNYTVNSLEWRSLYDNTVKQLAAELKGAFGKFGKMSFNIDDYSLVLDGRNPASLTRIPSGFRNGKPVHESEYFYSVQTENFLDIEHFGDLEEFDKQYKDISGYNLIDFTPEMQRQKRALPEPKDFPKLPKYIHPFSWPDGPPKQGEREIAIFHAVSNAKHSHKDSLTPEQYYAYFHDAIINKMDTSNTDMPAEVQLWQKIIRNWYVRSEADTHTGKKLDMTHLRNSGSKGYFKGKDFDGLKGTKGLFAYAKKKLLEYADIIYKSGIKISVLNPPPGAGKSTVAEELFRKRPSLYIAPSYKDLTAFRANMGKMHINEVLSYRMLIPVVAEDVPERDAMVLAYAAYEEMRKNSPADLFIPQTEIIKPFWQFIRIQFPEASTRLRKENERRTKCLEDGMPSMITRDKLMTIINREGIQMLPSDFQVIFDEARPRDIINPEDYKKNKATQVYGEVYEPKELDNEFNNFAFKQFLENRPAILINADKGLDRALKKNSYTNYQILGDEMPDILDLDAFLIFSPHLRAGYIKHRPDYDEDELSARALMAGFTTRGWMADATNKEHSIMITNGCAYSGEKLSAVNLVNAIGDNKFNNCVVFSLITCPTPEEIADLHFCTGLSVERSEDLIVQNKVNQIVGRNTGYRSLETHRDWREANGKPPLEKKDVHNAHYAIIPEKYIARSLKLNVKSTNVFTDQSTRIPKHVDIFLKPIDKKVTDRITLYNIEPGTCVEAKRVCKSLNISVAKLKDYLEDNQGLFPDYSFKSRGVVDGENIRNVLHRHKTIGCVIRQALTETYESLKMTEFITVLKDLSNERYIETMTAKRLKTIIREEAFHYEYRSVMQNHVEYLCPTDEEFIFRKKPEDDLHNAELALV